MAVDPNVDVVARTIAGEARSEGFLDMLAVGAVIRERVLRPGWWGTGWQSVCRAPFQFSCWNQNDPNHKKILHAEAEFPDVWPLCLAAAEFTVYHMRDRDLQQLFSVRGPFPDHYHAKNMKPPSWTKGAKALSLPWDSPHLFYTGVQGSPPRRHFS